MATKIVRSQTWKMDLPDDSLSKNVDRKAFHVYLNFYVTQMLSRHGCFRAYPHKIRKADRDRC